MNSLQDSFLAGLSTSCQLIGTLCLLGAVAALVWLPGKVRAEATVEPVPEPVAA